MKTDFLKRMSVLVMLLSISIMGYSQYMFDVQKTFETFGQEYDSKTLTKTPDGGAFIVVNNRIDSITIIKIDSNQIIQWHKSHFLNKDAVRVNDAEYLSSGGLIIGGITIAESGAGLRGFLIETDAAGDIMWYKEYDDSEMLVTSVVESSFGFMTVGYQNDNTITHGVIMGVDNNGVNIGSYVVRSTKADGGGTLGSTKLQEISHMGPGTYSCIGYTNSFGVGIAPAESDAVVIVVNNNGMILGNWVYGNNYPFSGPSQTEHGIATQYVPADRAILCLGHARSENTNICGLADFDDIWLWKIDESTGAIIWSQRIDVANFNLQQGCIDNIVKPEQFIYENGEIAICGSINYLAANEPAFILRTSSTGVPTDLRVYYFNHPSVTNRLYNIYASNHNSYVMAGESDLSGIGPQIYTVESYNLVSDVCEVTEPEYGSTEFLVPDLAADLAVQSVTDYTWGWDPFINDFDEIEHCPRIPDPGPPAPAAPVTSKYEPGEVFISTHNESTLVLESRDAEKVYELHVYALSGQRVTSVITGQDDAVVMNGQISLNIVDIPAGVYLIRAVSGEDEELVKFIKN